jgi:hypothetical protein
MPAIGRLVLLVLALSVNSGTLVVSQRPTAEYPTQASRSQQGKATAEISTPSIGRCLATARRLNTGWGEENLAASLQKLKFDTGSYRDQLSLADSRAGEIAERDLDSTPRGTDRFKTAIVLLYEYFLRSVDTRRTEDTLRAPDTLERPLAGVKTPWMRIEECRTAADQEFTQTMFGAYAIAFRKPSTASHNPSLSRFDISDPRVFADLPGYNGIFRDAALDVLAKLKTWWERKPPAVADSQSVLLYFKPVQPQVVALASWAIPNWPLNLNPADVDYPTLMDVLYPADQAVADDQSQRSAFCAMGGISVFGQLRTIWVGVAGTDSSIQPLSDGSIGVRRIWGWDEAQKAYAKGDLPTARKWELVMEENRLRSIRGQSLNLTDTVSKEYRFLKCTYSPDRDACVDALDRKESFEKTIDGLTKAPTNDYTGPCSQRAPAHRYQCESDADAKRRRAHEECAKKIVGAGTVDPVDPRLVFEQEKRPPTTEEVLAQCIESHCSKVQRGFEPNLDLPGTPTSKPQGPPPLLDRNRTEEARFSQATRELVRKHLEQVPRAQLQVTSEQRTEGSHHTSAGTDLRSRDLPPGPRREQRAQEYSALAGPKFNVIVEEPFRAADGTLIRQNKVYVDGRLANTYFDGRPTRSDFASHIHVQVNPNDRKELADKWREGDLTCASAGMRECP